MRALDANAAQREFVYDKNVRGIFDCKVYSELLRFFADLPNVSPERKERYVALLGKVAATYADEIDKLKRRSLYALNSLRATFTCARLLFDAGESVIAVRANIGNVRSLSKTVKQATARLRRRCIIRRLRSVWRGLNCATAR